MPVVRVRRHALVILVAAAALATSSLLAPSSGAASPDFRPTASARKPLPRLVPVGSDALTRALRSGSLTPARYALARAPSLFALAGPRAHHRDRHRPTPRRAATIPP